jgi:hypothetical protein
LKYKLKVDLDCLIVLISLQVLSMKTNWESCSQQWETDLLKKR